MHIGRRLALIVALFLILVQISCISRSEISLQKPVSKQTVLKYVESGFVKGYGTNRLFCDDENSLRMKVLLEHLGYGDFEWLRFTISSDQKYLRFWQYKDDYLHRSVTRVLVLGEDAEPKMYEFPQVETGLVLDNNNKPVAWTNERKANCKWIFASSGAVLLPAMGPFDNTGEYFCSGGLYFDYESEIRKEIPLYIYSVHNPSKPLIRSNLHHAPEEIFTTKQKVYLVGTNRHREGILDIISGGIPDGITCEIYNREGGKLKLTKEFVINCPLHFGAKWLSPECFDEDANVMLLRLEKAKFFEPEYYLLNMDTLKLTKVRRSCNQLRFIDPNLIRDIISAKAE